MVETKGPGRPVEYPACFLKTCSEAEARHDSENDPSPIIRLIAQERLRAFQRQREIEAALAESRSIAAALARAIVTANRSAALSGIAYRSAGRRSFRSTVRRVERTGTDDGSGPEPPGPARRADGLPHNLTQHGRARSASGAAA